MSDRLFFDTNVLPDHLLDREPFADDLEPMSPVLVENSAKPAEQPNPQPVAAVPTELAAPASNWADLP